MAANIFWKFSDQDVKGSSLVKGHEGEQEIRSYRHSWEQPTNPVRSAAGGGTIERAHHGTFNMTMELDESYKAMASSLWSGKHIEKGTLTCYRVAGDGTVQMGVPYLKIELEAIVITHLDISGGPGELPKVDFALGFEKARFAYVPQAAGEIPPAKDPGSLDPTSKNPLGATAV